MLVDEKTTNTIIVIFVEKKGAQNRENRRSPGF